MYEQWWATCVVYINFYGVKLNFPFLYWIIFGHTHQKLEVITFIINNWNGNISNINHIPSRTKNPNLFQDIPEFTHSNTLCAGSHQQQCKDRSWNWVACPQSIHNHRRPLLEESGSRHLDEQPLRWSQWYCSSHAGQSIAAGYPCRHSGHTPGYVDRAFSRASQRRLLWPWKLNTQIVIIFANFIP